jgi:hypothetical protein
MASHVIDDSRRNLLNSEISRVQIRAKMAKEKKRHANTDFDIPESEDEVWFAE